MVLARLLRLSGSTHIMPDPAPAKRRSCLGQSGSAAEDISPKRQRGPSLTRRVSIESAPTRYAELHSKTNFSFLRGASYPDELVNRAIELGYDALAITDRNSLAGVVRAHVAAKAVGLKLIIGAEITPEDGPALLLYAPDRAAYGRLSRLITRGRLRAVKGDCLLRVDDVAEHADGLLAAVLECGDLSPLSFSHEFE